MSGEKVDIKPGNAMPLANMPVGTIVHNVRDEEGPRRPDRPFRWHLRPARRQGRGLRPAQTQFGRGALVPSECLATVGAVSNPDNQNTVVGKAGRSRWLGRRPVGSWR